MSFLKSLFRNKRRRLEYINNGRSGRVIYKDGLGELEFYYEFGGGNCVAIIFIPSVNEWTAQTKRNINERHEILTFIAEQIIKDKSPDSYSEISGSYIEILKK